MVLKPECRKLIIFITIFGRFIFKIMPSRISTSPKCLDKDLAGLEGCKVNMDDIVVIRGSPSGSLACNKAADY